MPRDDDIVAVALLTRADVRRIGSTLKRVYRVEGSEGFEDLIKALDAASENTNEPE